MKWNFWKSVLFILKGAPQWPFNHQKWDLSPVNYQYIMSLTASLTCTLVTAIPWVIFSSFYLTFVFMSMFEVCCIKDIFFPEILFLQKCPVLPLPPMPFAKLKVFGTGLLWVGGSFKARCPRRNTFQGKSITANYIDCGKKICNTWAWAAQNQW